jgi:hypothetical protein
MKRVAILVAFAYLVSHSSCIKYRTKYKCERNCVPITIKLNVTRGSNLQLLGSNKFEIILRDNLSGSADNNRIMASGIAEINGNFTTTVNCDTSLLNSKEYYIKIEYEWDVNTIQVCYDSLSSFMLDDYPVGGIANINIQSYRKWKSTLDFVKRSNDNLKTAYVIFDKGCNYNQASLPIAKDSIMRLNAKTYLDCMNYVTIGTIDTLNNIHEISDSVYIDNNFSGKTFEY